MKWLKDNKNHFTIKKWDIPTELSIFPVMLKNHLFSFVFYTVWFSKTDRVLLLYPHEAQYLDRFQSNSSKTSFGTKGIVTTNVLLFIYFHYSASNMLFHHRVDLCAERVSRIPLSNSQSFSIWAERYSILLQNVSVHQQYQHTQGYEGLRVSGPPQICIALSDWVSFQKLSDFFGNEHFCSLHHLQANCAWNRKQDGWSHFHLIYCYDNQSSISKYSILLSFLFLVCNWPEFNKLFSFTIDVPLFDLTSIYSLLPSTE